MNDRREASCKSKTKSFTESGKGKSSTMVFVVGRGEVRRGKSGKKAGHLPPLIIRYPSKTEGVFFSQDCPKKKGLKFEKKLAEIRQFCYPNLGIQNSSGAVIAQEVGSATVIGSRH